MFVASKLKETVPLNAEKLVKYTDCSITLEELLVSKYEKKCFRSKLLDIIAFLFEKLINLAARSTLRCQGKPQHC